MPPFLGQGLGAGVRDSVNLVWKLDAVEHLGANPRILDTYGEERKPHVRTVVSLAKSFGLIIGELDPNAARKRDARLRAELESGKAETVRQKFIPGLDSGLIDTDSSGAPKPGAGSLFVQPRVRIAGSPHPALLDDVAGPGFLMAFTDSEALGWLDADTTAAWKRLNGKSVVVSDTDVSVSSPMIAAQEDEGIFRDFMATQQARVVVVRPDRYVYGLAADASTLRRLVLELHERVLSPA
jgi:3-(3-hydroxy-phenyl)propionate hydroxylase